MRTLRRLLFWIVDLAAIAGIVACILHFSRRQSVDCAWHEMRASCAVEAEDSLGRVKAERIEGIRGAAFVLGADVGLVTDASNKDALAFFGTQVIQLRRAPDAKALYDFAERRVPDRVSFASGVAHPLWLTLALLGVLLAYAVVSRRARVRRADV